MQHFTGPKQKAVLRNETYYCQCGNDLIHQDDAERLIKHVQQGIPLVVECSIQTDGSGCMAINEIG